METTFDFAFAFVLNQCKGSSVKVSPLGPSRFRGAYQGQ
jgi:hypothetical protein